MSNVAPAAEQLAPAETPFQQVWRAFRKDRLAVAGLYVLAALVVLALVGKLLTEWWVVFDPTTVRLPDKLRPPFSTPSAELLSAQLPTWGIYPFGTDELGRNVFARMLQGSFISLSVGIVAVSISLVIGVSREESRASTGNASGGRSASTACSCASPTSCCVFPHFS
jgi:peptide/nickel transport system permease protein